MKIKVFLNKNFNHNNTPLGSKSFVFTNLSISLAQIKSESKSTFNYQSGIFKSILYNSRLLTCFNNTKILYTYNRSILSNTFLFSRVFRRYLIPKIFWYQIIQGFIGLFVFMDFRLLKISSLKLFSFTRVDKHGRIFRFLVKFFKKFPYISRNIVSISIKIKGKMSRKGVARKKTNVYVRTFRKNIKTIFKKNFFFLIIADTGCTGFFCGIIHTH